MEYYTAEKNNILNFAGIWMELENIILSEVTQIQKENFSNVQIQKWFLNLKEEKPVYKS